MASMRGPIMTSNSSIYGLCLNDSSMTYKCTVCGAEFKAGPQYEWYHANGDKRAYFCGYNHMRQWERDELERKEIRSLEALNNNKGVVYARVWMQTKEGCRKRIYEVKEVLAQKEAEFDVMKDGYQKRALGKNLSWWRSRLKQAEERLAELEGNNVQGN